jgi:ribosomal protein L13E
MLIPSISSIIETGYRIRVDGPIIKRWKRGIEIVRGGRGYSKAELDEVGLRDLRNVRNHGIPVDPLRKLTTLKMFSG